MGTRTSALVIENDPTDDARRLGDWLVEGGLDLAVVRAYVGDELPDSLDGYAALIVLGGDQDAFPTPDGTRAAPWFPAVESLLRKATRYGVATLAICLGGQLLATAHGGTVRRIAAGPEIGPRLVARRDAAERDSLWAPVPLAPDVLQWHRDEITELPAGATLLAASPRHPVQAFRIGSRAWGTQFHIECDPEMISDWVSSSDGTLAQVGYTGDEVVRACTEVMDDLEEVWRPFAHRFAAIARGELDPDVATAVLGRPTLPLLGQ